MSTIKKEYMLKQLKLINQESMVMFKDNQSEKLEEQEDFEKINE